jgi:hypothetical protein
MVRDHGHVHALNTEAMATANTGGPTHRRKQRSSRRTAASPNGAKSSATPLSPRPCSTASCTAQN